MLIQSAHAVRTGTAAMSGGPGPLGHFFRRLKQRKPYNVAVVAVAHKLALLAWHLLVKNEPYRYALPKATETKLQKLRVAATGQKRRSGPAPGKKCQAKLPGGSRTIRPLAEVYAGEGVPAASAAPAGTNSIRIGARRHVAGLKLDSFVDRLQQTHVVPRRKPEPEGEQPAGAKSSRIGAGG